MKNIAQTGKIVHFRELPLLPRKRLKSYSKFTVKLTIVTILDFKLAVT